MESKIEQIVCKYLNLIEIRRFYRSQSSLSPSLESEIASLKSSPGVKQVTVGNSNHTLKTPRVSINILNDNARLFMTISDHK
jgi:hypothetical protein